jgi:antitoxin (DNA-binding transcriptional repressor) of toxin-antitoxin stability system
MRVSLVDAETRLTDRLERAEAGETIILAQDGRPIVRLEPIGPARNRRTQRAVLDDVRLTAAVKPSAGPDAACSQDFLYGTDGLPV